MGQSIPLMLVAMPSSGSDWFADCIARSNPDLRRPPLKEFFTPICNLDNYRELAEVFGCETIDSFDNIARPVTSGRRVKFYNLADRLWRSEWRFTKEVWLGLQVSLVSDRFHCIGMTRDVHNTFPPRRLRVWQWYGAIADSLAFHGLVSADSPPDLKSKASLAHRYLRKAISSSCSAVVRWEDLVSGDSDRVAAACELLSGFLDPITLAAEVLKTAAPRARLA